MSGQLRGEGSPQMSLRNRGEPSGFAGGAAPVMSAATRRANKDDLTRLKALLESRRSGCVPSGRVRSSTG